MSDIAINWSAAPNAQDPVNAGFAGAEEGYKLGQTRAMVHALQGIDINNPKSIDAGIGNLVRANAGEQATALQNLAWTRYLRSQAPAFQAKISALGGPDASPAAAPASEPQQSPVDHVAETYQIAKAAADKIGALPEGERAVAFAQMTPDLKARGIPQEALDSAGQHLAGDGPQQLSDYYGKLLDHAQGAAGPDGQPAALPAPHPSTAWAGQLLGDPGFMGQMDFMKGQGLDYTGLIDTAKTLAGPTIAKNAEIAAAPTLAGIDVAKQNALVPVEAAKAGAVERATLPYKAALASATADIQAGHEVISVPEVGPDGQPTGRTSVYRKDVALGKGADGKPIGTAQSPAEAGGQTDDAHMFMTKYSEEGNQAAITADRNASTSAIAAAHMAQNLDPSNLTAWTSKVANTLNGLGIKIAKGEANKLATYENLLNQNVKNGIAVFPKNQAEFHAISGALPGMSTPGDAAALTLTTLAAIKDQAAAEKQFRIDWANQNPGKYSERTFQEAWAHQPGANQSVFASPLFADLKIDGKPAVKVYPPYRDGHVYGVFMPGTPQKTAFMVR